MNQTFFLLIEKLEKKILLFLKREIKLCVCVCDECVWCVRMTECNDRFRKTSDRETADYNRNDYNEKCRQPRRRHSHCGEWKETKTN